MSEATKMTLRELRKLDGLAAEKVLELHCAWDRGICFVARQKYDTHVQFVPTEDMRDAWRLLEKFERGHLIDAWRDADGWNVRIVGHAGSFEAVADTAPLAITLAALKAVGVEAR